MAIILSGVGGSSNWLPLILPLAAIVVMLKAGETIVRYVKRKKLEHENRVIQSPKDPAESDNPAR